MYFPRLQAQVFLNQLYKTPVELNLEKNPDLRAIRFASFNPILDPWIYILLRKAVLLKLIEKIKCLFCKMGANRRQQRQGSLNRTDSRRQSSVISKQGSLSLVSHGLRDATTSSQAFLYFPEGSELFTGSCHTVMTTLHVSSVRGSRASCASEQAETQTREGTSKDPGLQVSLSTETVEEKRI